MGEIWTSSAVPQICLLGIKWPYIMSFPLSTDFLNITFMCSLVLGVSMVLSSHPVSKRNNPNCSVLYIRNISKNIAKELRSGLENCTEFLNENYNITIGNMTHVNNTHGFQKLDPSTIDCSQVLVSIFHHAQKMQPIVPVNSTIRLVKHCITRHSGDTMHQSKKRRRRRRNLFNKDLCLQMLGLRQLWMIYRAHYNLKDDVLCNHTKTE
ncbi:uncharacterized protein LOC143793797 [Ranitomeya variabilis]|uniref:uncharacterized protein LOC143793797 n=1 Tax=Ranitomeya variabilis TaxID=490064 RepID=UPI004057614D